MNGQKKKERRKKMALTKISIEVKGPTGSGKTTVLNIIRDALSSYDIQSKRKGHTLIAEIERHPFPKEKKDGETED